MYFVLLTNLFNILLLFMTLNKITFCSRLMFVIYAVYDQHRLKWPGHPDIWEGSTWTMYQVLKLIKGFENEFSRTSGNNERRKEMFYLTMHVIYNYMA